MYQYDESNRSKRTTKPLAPAERKNRKFVRFIKYIALMVGATALIGVLVYGVWSWCEEGDYGIWSNTAGDDADGQSGDAELTKQAAEQELQTAGSYEEIYEYLETLWEERSAGSVKSYSTQEVAQEAAADSAVSTESTVDADTGAYSTGSSSQKIYSDTNTRTEEVGEADIVKTDGNYLYISDGDRIRIVDIRDPWHTVP